MENSVASLLTWTPSLRFISIQFAEQPFFEFLSNPQPRCIRVKSVQRNLALNDVIQDRSEVLLMPSNEIDNDPKC